MALRPKPGARALDAGLRKQEQSLRRRALPSGYCRVTGADAGAPVSPEA